MSCWLQKIAAVESIRLPFFADIFKLSVEPGEGFVLPFDVEEVGDVPKFGDQADADRDVHCRPPPVNQ